MPICTTVVLHVKIIYGIFHCYLVNNLMWCSIDADCKANESCNVIDLNYKNVSRCRCKQGYHRMTTWEPCTGKL